MDNDKLNFNESLQKAKNLGDTLVVTLTPDKFVNKGPKKPAFKEELRLEKEDIEALIKAKSALVGIDNMKINTTRNLDDEKVCEFVFGDEMGHNNKITYQLRGRIDNEDLSLPFTSDMFKTVLYANKDKDYGTLRLSSVGLLHLQFISDTITSNYYMVRKADESF